MPHVFVLLCFCRGYRILRFFVLLVFVVFYSYVLLFCFFDFFVFFLNLRGSHGSVSFRFVSVSVSVFFVASVAVG